MQIHLTKVILEYSYGDKNEVFNVEFTVTHSVATLLGTQASHNIQLYKDPNVQIGRHCCKHAYYNYMFITEVIVKGGVELDCIILKGVSNFCPSYSA